MIAGRHVAASARRAYTTGEKWLRPPLYPFFLAAAFVTAGYDTARTRYTVPLPGGACRVGEPLVVSLRNRTGFVDQPEQPLRVGVAVARAGVE